MAGDTSWRGSGASAVKASHTAGLVSIASGSPMGSASLGANEWGAVNIGGGEESWSFRVLKAPF
eukprot:2607992-Pyramimonas_sp.AAC.1